MPVKESRSRTPKPRIVPQPIPAHFYPWWLWSGQPTFEGVCVALAQQNAILDGLLQPLLVTGTAVGPLDSWRVAVHVAHLTSVADQVVAAAQESPVAPSGLDAIDWYRRRDPRIAAVVAEAVARVGAGRAVRSGLTDLVLRHRAASATAVAILRSGAPGRILGGPADGLDLAEFTVTRLVEAVVHGLDLAAALGHPGHVEPAAANLVSGFLAAVADRGSPDASAAPIAVDGQGSLIVLSGERRKARIPAVEWIHAATGRRPAGDLLPRSHDWLAAGLPLVA